MPTQSHSHDDMTGVAARWLMGFVGAVSVLFLLPRIVSYTLRHYAFRLIAEIVAIVSLGLLTEKLFQWTVELDPPESDGN